MSQKDPDDVVIDKWKNIIGDDFEIIVSCFNDYFSFIVRIDDLNKLN